LERRSTAGPQPPAEDAGEGADSTGLRAEAAVRYRHDTKGQRTTQKGCRAGIKVSGPVNILSNFISDPSRSIRTELQSTTQEFKRIPRVRFAFEIFVPARPPSALRPGQPGIGTRRRRAARLRCLSSLTLVTRPRGTSTPAASQSGPQLVKLSESQRLVT